ncbi:MAG: glycoside hydrolase family 88 protein [Chitinophagaceae bacterium]
MKSVLTNCLALLITVSSFSQFSNTWSVKFSEGIRTRWTTAPVTGRVCIDKMTSKGWEYSNGIVLHGMEKVYDHVGDANYLNYIKTYVDNYVNTDGTFKTGVTFVSLDKIHPGILLLFLKQQYPLQTQYGIAATTLRNQLVGAAAPYNSFKTPINSIFWHKQSGYTNIVMLDGMYMAHPFLAKYAAIYNDAAARDTAINQTLFCYNQLYTAGNHLIKHAWKEPGSSGTVAWDDVAGNSTSVWSRAMGWYTMALIDIIKYTPAAHPKRAQLLTALGNLAIGLKDSQDPTSKLWFQVMDKTNISLPNNFIETSGSAMFIYVLKTACDYGWINSATFLPVAQSAWTGIQAKISINADTYPQINDFAPAMSVQDNEGLYVQASLQGIDCPGTAHPHGYAAILMAASAMEFPPLTLPVKFISFTAKDLTNKIQLTWENGDENGVDHYEIQKSNSGNDFITIGSVNASGIAKYSWDDNSAITKTVYYRIKAVSDDGSAHYTAILPIQKKNIGAALQVSPNPVKDGLVNIFLNSIQTGKYNLNIINSIGNIIESRPVGITIQGNTVITLSLPTGSGKGVYYVQLDGNGIKMNKSIMVK